jgi:hypothetical protein
VLPRAERLPAQRVQRRRHAGLHAHTTRYTDFSITENMMSIE